MSRSSSKSSLEKSVAPSFAATIAIPGSSVRLAPGQPVLLPLCDQRNQ